MKLYKKKLFYYRIKIDHIIQYCSYHVWSHFYSYQYNDDDDTSLAWYLLSFLLGKHLSTVLSGGKPALPISTRIVLYFCFFLLLFFFFICLHFFLCSSISATRNTTSYITSNVYDCGELGIWVAAAAASTMTVWQVRRKHIATLSLYSFTCFFFFFIHVYVCEASVLFNRVQNVKSESQHWYVLCFLVNKSVWHCYTNYTESHLKLHLCAGCLCR